MEQKCNHARRGTLLSDPLRLNDAHEKGSRLHMFGQTQLPREIHELEIEITERFGILPNFFRLSSEVPQNTANLWGFAQAAYLDNPLPSLFKERLFVYLSRFCEVRYCIARHGGFLLGLASARTPFTVPGKRKVVGCIQRQ